MTPQTFSSIMRYIFFVLEYAMVTYFVLLGLMIYKSKGNLNAFLFLVLVIGTWQLKVFFNKVQGDGVAVLSVTNQLIVVGLGVASGLLPVIFSKLGAHQRFG